MPRPGPGEVEDGFMLEVFDRRVKAKRNRRPEQDRIGLKQADP